MDRLAFGQLSANHKIAIIGSGNVATTFARILNNHADIVEIYSRHIEHAQTLASQMHNPDCRAIDNLDLIRKDCTLYIIAVADDAIAEVVSKMPEGIKGLVVHTSGSIGIDVLKDKFSNYGSLYPLQTMSKNVEIEGTDINIFTEASNEESLEFIDSVAMAINPAKPNHITSDIRATLHVAAVFACNFPNFLWGCAADILSSANLPLNVFSPLIKATCAKAMNAPDGNPHKVQTGPAMRGDLEVISRHIESLPQKLSDIYRTLSQSIIDYHSK